MAKTLRNYVYLINDKGQTVAFGPGMDVPAWAQKEITNPNAWVEDDASEPELEPTPEPIQPEPTPGPEDLVPEVDPDAIDDEVTPNPTSEDPDAGRMIEPPRTGAGSSKDAWRSYAEAKGIEVPADASRDDIVRLVDNT